ncbi:hypothetical protein [Alicyclobacillus sp. ALC3]|uniref:hypothetical protein n=1 Tax=Alicyclobacillus sp. ALC3 TaxID=2796143 RepID=UPI002378E6A9|nr:hypothetical protein [Alicyclobacillus sp. ALC3]WDL96422.1 hypothetical protein JC200_19165 [Alicyclobacillus sp. ALC3]
MCSRDDCSQAMGQWVRFQTRWGVHRGIVESVNQRAVLVRMPRQYAPVGLTSHSTAGETDDTSKLDIALAAWSGYGGYGRGYGRGAPGYGGWYGGWWWWWLAFACFIE